MLKVPGTPTPLRGFFEKTSENITPILLWLLGVPIVIILLMIFGFLR